MRSIAKARIDDAQPDWTTFFGVAFAVAFGLGALVGALLPLPEIAKRDALDDDIGGLDPPSDPYSPTFNASAFAPNVTNAYFPLALGPAWRYEGDTEKGHELTEVVVLAECRVILGISCTVVRDTVRFDGEVIELTHDWYAQDGDGTVWYLGEAVDDYDGGVVVSHEGSWQARVGSAKAGIIMFANPQPGCDLSSRVLAR